MQDSKDVRARAIQLCRQLRKRQTNAERILWSVLRNRQFMNLKFFRQYPFFHEEAGSLQFYIADFFCRELGIVIELDGSSHQLEKEYDTERSSILAASGIRVVRFCNKMVEDNLGRVLRELEEFLRG